MRAAKQLLFYYLAVLFVLLIFYIWLWYIHTYWAFALICLVLSVQLLRRFLYPFRKLDRNPDGGHYFWKIYTYIWVINLFALTAYAIIDVAIDNKLSPFFRYWFFIWIGSLVPPAVVGGVYGVYQDIQRVRHSGDKKEGETAGELRRQ